MDVVDFYIQETAEALNLADHYDSVLKGRKPVENLHLQNSSGEKPKTLNKKHSKCSQLYFSLSNLHNN